jgi:hypothetical protein
MIERQAQVLGDGCTQYAGRYLAAIAYRFNHQFQLKTLPGHLLVAALGTSGPGPEAWLWIAEDSY